MTIKNRLIVGKEEKYKPIVYVSANDMTDLNSIFNFSEYICEKGGIPIIPRMLYRGVRDKKEKVRMNLVLMGKADEVWVLGNKIDEVMEEELELAKKRKQTIRHFIEGFKEVINNEFYNV